MFPIKDQANHWCTFWSKRMHANEQTKTDMVLKWY